MTAAFVTSLLAEAEHTVVELPLPLLTYPAVALVLFVALAGVLWSYRDVANRHSAKAEAYAKAHGGGAAGGH
ncbi:hypothetical protein D6T64_20615 [Cryobacterium melibiosiphilum]|uniref:4-hydroxybenzoate polyprenyltransferase n=1 Tax=Cryobacterium melibiosiphilum TaxID=995039 RepID=A0A3A5MBX7_9MICO|nr:hypothetical protein D6T64_20615 [Cryobacterium melibiosiphilum]